MLYWKAYWTFWHCDPEVFHGVQYIFPHQLFQKTLLEILLTREISRILKEMLAIFDIKCKTNMATNTAAKLALV